VLVTVVVKERKGVDRRCTGGWCFSFLFSYYCIEGVGLGHLVMYEYGGFDNIGGASALGRSWNVYFFFLSFCWGGRHGLSLQALIILLRL